MLIGIVAGGVCFWACTWLKRKVGYDDFARRVRRARRRRHLPAPCSPACSRSARFRQLRSCLAACTACSRAIRGQVVAQLYGIVVTLVWSGRLTFVILKIVGLFVPLARAPGRRGHGSRRQPSWRSAPIAARSSAISPLLNFKQALSSLARFKRAWLCGPHAVRRSHRSSLHQTIFRRMPADLARRLIYLPGYACEARFAGKAQ